jgi:hypothetical protein
MEAWEIEENCEWLGSSYDDDDDDDYMVLPQAASSVNDNNCGIGDYDTVIIAGKSAASSDDEEYDEDEISNSGDESYFKDIVKADIVNVLVAKVRFVQSFICIYSSFYSFLCCLFV